MREHEIEEYMDEMFEYVNEEDLVENELMFKWDMQGWRDCYFQTVKGVKSFTAYFRIKGGTGYSRIVCLTLKSNGGVNVAHFPADKPYTPTQRETKLINATRKYLMG